MVGGATWDDATPLALGTPSDPSPAVDYLTGTARPYHRAWWTFTVADPAVDTVVVDTFATTGADPDTQVYVYSGATFADRVEVAFNDDAGDAYTSQAMVPVAPGTYHVMVGTYDTSTTDIDSYVVTATPYATEVSEWADGEPAWTTTVGVNTASATYSHGFASTSNDGSSTPFEDAWTGTGPVLDTGLAGAAHQLDGVNNNFANWAHTWLTISRPSSGSLAESSLPPGETVTDLDTVEWEPSTTPLAQRLTIRFGDSNSGRPPVVVPGETIYVKQGPAPVSAPYDPGFETAATVSAYPDLTTFVAAGSTDSVTVLGSDLPMPLTGVASMTVALSDQYTEAQTPPAYTPPNSFSRAYPFTATLEAQFQPRYRIIRLVPVGPPTPAVVAAVRVTPSLRMLQRGGPGGMSGIPRMVGNPVRGLRQGPGSVY